MSGEIKISKNGTVRDQRPAWRHNRPAGNDYPGDNNASLEMLESIRNVLEDINKSQMLQCDVRQMILELRFNSERTRKAIERIDRRLAKAEKLR